ncbi:MAG TPA: hypothetical protein VKK81_04625 [Candidatus Binatia bacterium]|nr:hypothetical protein [Candidatus Binatia bacterium]
MWEIREREWQAVQSDIDACRECECEGLLELVDPPPARPDNPGHSGRLLFISEAPPIPGGFWEVGRKDALRENLLTLLQEQGFDFPSDFHSPEALDAFLAHGFFLLQTLKWPFAQREGTEGERKRRPSFNHLGPAQQRRLIKHSVNAHLRRELELIAPSGILALGNAAWQACGKLSQCPLPLQGGGFEAHLGKEYPMALPSGSIPLHVTYLPVEQNMKIPERAQAIKKHLKDFLERAKQP